MPADEPAGYLDAFATALRAMARLCEEARDGTCVSLKRLALKSAPSADDAASILAHGRAVNALLTIVNHQAQSEGVDPYGRPKP